MKERKSPSTYYPSAAVSVICLLNPGLILIKFKAIKALYLLYKGIKDILSFLNSLFITSKPNVILFPS